MILIDARASEHVITMVINTIIPGMIMMLLINDPRYDHDNNPRYDHDNNPRYDHNNNPRYDHDNNPRYDHDVVH